jgi:hypothetical protein
MAVTDDQVAALRAWLTARTDTGADDAVGQFITLARTGRLDEVGALVYGAFAAAARRRFSPAWASADIVGFVAEFRSSSTEAAHLVSPLAAENQLRGVLGEKQATRPPEEARAYAQFMLLGALTVALDPQELDSVLTEGRGLADQLIAGRSPATAPASARTPGTGPAADTPGSPDHTPGSAVPAPGPTPPPPRHTAGTPAPRPPAAARPHHHPRLREHRRLRAPPGGPPVSGCQAKDGRAAPTQT